MFKKGTIFAMLLSVTHGPLYWSRVHRGGGIKERLDITDEKAIAPISEEYIHQNQEKWLQAVYDLGFYASESSSAKSFSFNKKSYTITVNDDVIALSPEDVAKLLNMVAALHAVSEGAVTDDNLPKPIVVISPDKGKVYVIGVTQTQDRRFYFILHIFDARPVLLNDSAKISATINSAKGMSEKEKEAIGNNERFIVNKGMSDSEKAQRQSLARWAIANWKLPENIRQALGELFAMVDWKSRLKDPAEYRLSYIDNVYERIKDVIDNQSATSVSSKILENSSAVLTKKSQGQFVIVGTGETVTSEDLLTSIKSNEIGTIYAGKQAVLYFDGIAFQIMGYNNIPAKK